MKKYGLIGYPLTHSFSKKYFSDKFNREGKKIAGMIYMKSQRSKIYRKSFPHRTG